MDAARTAEDYFGALARRDAHAAAAMWSPGGAGHLFGVGPVQGPAGVQALFGEIFAAIPDWRMELRAVVAEGEQVAVRWRAAGTFSGGPFQGIEPTGSRLDLEGLDLLTIRDGRIHANDAFMDGLTYARQLGLLPAQGSPAEARLQRAFNARTRAARRLAAGPPEAIAPGVWRVRGGFPARTMNVYLVAEPDGGVLAFDAGVRQMAPAIAAAAAQLGGLTRVVLGHAHPDHRGAASRLHAPVLCHPAERADAEGDGGRRYAHPERLTLPARWVLPRLLAAGDGGPVEVAGTLEEGEDVAGFRVIHVPGHAPGQIALVRDADGVALTTDTFFVVDLGTGRPVPARVPEPAVNHDTEQARASLRKLAALAPSVCWPGHGAALRGDVRAVLEAAAAR